MTQNRTDKLLSISIAGRRDGSFLLSLDKPRNPDGINMYYDIADTLGLPKEKASKLKNMFQLFFIELEEFLKD